MKTRLDKAVKDGDLTQKQADKILEHLDVPAEGARVQARAAVPPPLPRRAAAGGQDDAPGTFVPGEGRPEIIEGAIYN